MKMKGKKILAILCSITMLAGLIPYFGGVKEVEAATNTAPPTDLKEITFSDFGIKDGEYAGTFSSGYTQYAYSEDSLDGTLFNGNVTFSNSRTAELCFGNVASSEEATSNKGIRGLRIYRDADTNQLFMYDYFPVNAGFSDCQQFKPDIAGTTLVGEEFNLKISVQFVGEDADNDGKKDDVKLGFWFNDVLYNNTYKELKGQSKYFGNRITFLNWYNNPAQNGPIIVKSVVKMPDKNFKEITFRDFGIADGDYAGEYSFNITEGTYSGESLDKTVFNGDIKFGEGFTPEICFGNGYTAEGLINVKNRGLRIYRDTANPTKLYMYNYFPDAAFADSMSFDPTIAGTKLIGEEFNLKISVEFIGEDADEDGRKDDVKLGFWFNDVLYNNQYKELKGQAKYFGNKITMFNYYSADKTKNAPITVKSTKVLQHDGFKEITFCDFGISDGEYAGEYSFNITHGTYAGESLDGTLFNGNIKFCEGFQPEFCFGNGYTAEGVMNVDNRGLRIYRDTANPDRLFMYDYLPGGTATNISFDPKVAGTTLIGEEFNLKISVKFVGEDADADGRKDDVKLGIFFNDVLYNNAYIELKGQAKYFGNKITMFNYYDRDTSVNGPITVKSIQKKSDEGLSEISFDELGITDGTYTSNVIGVHPLAGSLMNYKFAADVKFTGEKACMYYASKSSDTDGLCFVFEKSGITLNYGSKTYTLANEELANSLYGNTVNLQLGLLWLDLDGDGVYDDAQLSTYINGERCNDGVIYFENIVNKLGAKIYIQPTNAILELSSPVAYHTSNMVAVTPADFGVADGTYDGVTGEVLESANFKKFEATVTLANVDDYLEYAGVTLKKSAENTLQIMRGEYNQLYELSGAEYTSLISDDSFTLEISTEYVDCDSDNWMDDAKMGIWINGQQIGNGYFYIYHSQSLCKTAQLKVQGTIASETVDMSYSCDAFTVDAEETQAVWNDFSSMKLVSGRVELPSAGAKLSLSLISQENAKILTIKRAVDGTVALSGLVDEDVTTNVSATEGITYACLLKPIDVDNDGIKDDVAIRVWLNGESIQNRQWFWYGCITENVATTLNVAASENVVMNQWLPEADLEYTYHNWQDGAYALNSLTGSGEIVVNRKGEYYAEDVLNLGDYVIVSDAFRTETATPIVVWKLGHVNSDETIDVKDLVAAKKVEQKSSNNLFSQKGADLTLDGSVNESDLEKLRLVLVGKENLE